MACLRVKEYDGCGATPGGGGGTVGGSGAGAGDGVGGILTIPEVGNMPLVAVSVAAACCN